MKLLMVFAHPDDETFSSSGTVSLLTRRGWTAKLICATRGEKGMLGDPPLVTPKKLGKVRELELRQAAKIVGISKIYFLGFIDGTLRRVDQKKLLEKISPIMIKEKPDVVLTFDKNGISNHPDHIAISKVTTSAFYSYMAKAKKKIRLYHVCLPKSILKKYEQSGFRYDSFGGMKGLPDEEVTTIVDIEKVFKLKEKAMKRHQTQRKDWERILARTAVIEGKCEYFKLIAENLI